MVKFFDMKLANKDIDIKSIISEAADMYEFSLGNFVENFESNFSKYLNVKHAVGVGNGTDGLEISLTAVGIKRDDYVLTVSNAGYYSTTAIKSIGAIPIYLDVHRNSTINLELLNENIERYNPSGIIVTHLFGQAVDMQKVKEIINGRNIKIIEDCAHAHGGEYKEKKLGSLGDVGVFSFYPTKNLGAVGDGGAVVTNDKKIYKRLLSLRQYGWDDKYEVGISGGRNSRLDALQAAVLMKKLEFLDQWNQERIHLANYYLENLQTTALELNENLSKNPAHLFTVLSNDRENLINHLNNNGIQTQIHYPIPDHKQKINETISKSLNVTEELSKKIFSLPFYPNIDMDNVNEVIKKIKEYI